MIKCKETREHLLELMAESNKKTAIINKKNAVTFHKKFKMRIDPFSKTNPNSGIRSPISEMNSKESNSKAIGKFNNKASHRKTDSGFSYTSNYSSTGNSKNKETLTSPGKNSINNKTVIDKNDQSKLKFISITFFKISEFIENCNIYPMDISCYFFLEEEQIKAEIIKVFQGKKMIIEQKVS